MPAFDTVIDALLAHAAAGPDRPCLCFDDGRPEPARWSYSQTLGAAEAALGGLVAQGLKRHDRMILIGGNDARSCALTLGAMGGGILPAIVHPPLRGEAGAARAQLRAVIERADPAVVIAPSGYRRVLPEGTHLLTAESVTEAGAPAVALVPQPPDAPAYLQFSSGTTGGQKAVALSGDAIAHNIDAMRIDFAAGPDDAWVVWLPMYHDMGLNTALTMPIYFGCRAVVMPPERFVEHPPSWMQAIDRHRGTLTAAPNFAYTLAARRLPKDLASLDLSCLRVAVNGAEMIHAASVRAFETAMAPGGLAPNTVYPGYGLAEFSLKAASVELGAPMRVDTVSRHGLAQGRADPSSVDAVGTLAVVSLGGPIHGHGLRIAGDDGNAVAERRVGEIELSGPSRMLGYWGDEEATAAAFNGQWLRTGDLGYLAGGELFICGRKKDIIKRFGETYYPADLEALAVGAAGIKPGRLAVFGVEDAALGTERVWLVFESEATGEVGVEQARAVRAHVLAAGGFKLDGVSAVPPRFIEKTSSGKARRFRCRQRLAELFVGDAPPTVGAWPGFTPRS